MAGSWDCLCAICCGPLNLCCVEIGEKEVNRGEEDEKSKKDEGSQSKNESVIQEPKDDEYSYSPSLVSEESIQWVHQGRAICYDHNTETPFITGPGYYDDYGGFEVTEPGDDPDDPGPDYMYQCYWGEVGDWVLRTFPYHEACYKVLAKRLGYNDASDIDKHALCNVMREHNGAYSLTLDYGGFDLEQTWACRRGEEVCIYRSLLTIPH